MSSPRPAAARAGACRVNLFDGRLVTGRDLELEQAHRDARFRAVAQVRGCGVAWGLFLSATRTDPDVTGAPEYGVDDPVELSPGLAFDGAGRRIEIAKTVRTSFAKLLQAAWAEPRSVVLAAGSGPCPRVRDGWADGVGKLGAYVAAVRAVERPVGKANVRRTGCQPAPSADHDTWSNGHELALLRFPHPLDVDEDGPDELSGWSLRSLHAAAWFEHYERALHEGLGTGFPTARSRWDGPAPIGSEAWVPVGMLYYREVPPISTPSQSASSAGTTLVFEHRVSGRDNLYHDPWIGNDPPNLIGMRGAVPASSVQDQGRPVDFADTTDGTLKISASGKITDRRPWGPDGYPPHEVRGLRRHGLIGMWSSAPGTIVPISGSAPFFIGSSETVSVPQGAPAAFLFLAFNDGRFRNNSGAWEVRIEARSKPASPAQPSTASTPAPPLNLRTAGQLLPMLGAGVTVLRHELSTLDNLFQEANPFSQHNFPHLVNLPPPVRAARPVSRAGQPFDFGPLKGTAVFTIRADPNVVSARLASQGKKIGAFTAYAPIIVWSSRPDRIEPNLALRFPYELRNQFRFNLAGGGKDSYLFIGFSDDHSNSSLGGVYTETIEIRIEPVRTGGASPATKVASFSIAGRTISYPYKIPLLTRTATLAPGRVALPAKAAPTTPVKPAATLPGFVAFCDAHMVRRDLPRTVAHAWAHRLWGATSPPAALARLRWFQQVVAERRAAIPDDWGALALDLFHAPPCGFIPVGSGAGSGSGAGAGASGSPRGAGGAGGTGRTFDLELQGRVDGYSNMFFENWPGNPRVHKFPHLKNSRPAVAFPDPGTPFDFAKTTGTIRVSATGVIGIKRYRHRRRATGPEGSGRPWNAWPNHSLIGMWSQAPKALRPFPGGMPFSIGRGETLQVPAGAGEAYLFLACNERKYLRNVGFWTVQVNAEVSFASGGQPDLTHRVLGTHNLYQQSWRNPYDATYTQDWLPSGKSGGGVDTPGAEAAKPVTGPAQQPFDFANSGVNVVRIEARGSIQWDAGGKTSGPAGRGFLLPGEEPDYRDLPFFALIGVWSRKPDVVDPIDSPDRVYFDSAERENRAFGIGAGPTTLQVPPGEPQVFLFLAFNDSRYDDNGAQDAFEVDLFFDARLAAPTVSPDRSDQGFFMGTNVLVLDTVALHEDDVAEEVGRSLTKDPLTIDAAPAALDDLLDAGGLRRLARLFSVHRPRPDPGDWLGGTARDLLRFLIHPDAPGKASVAIQHLVNRQVEAVRVLMPIDPRGRAFPLEPADSAGDEPLQSEDYVAYVKDPLVIPAWAYHAARVIEELGHQALDGSAWRDLDDPARADGDVDAWIGLLSGSVASLRLHQHLQALRALLGDRALRGLVRELQTLAAR